MSEQELSIQTILSQTILSQIVDKKQKKTSKPRKKTKQYTFELKGINPSEIDKQYGFDTLNHKNNDILLEEKFIPNQSTRITELNNVGIKDIVLTDEVKTNYNAKVSLINPKKNKKYHCFWDKHIILDKIYYCPIEKVHNPKIKEYTSSINGKKYKIQDSLVQDDNEYFIDGCFCSCECLLAFVQDNRHNPLYSKSEILAKELYNIHNSRIAPHWRLLDIFGGNMTIEDFRKSFTHISYEMNGIVFNPISFIYKESYHL